MQLANKIESILFFKGEPVSVKKLTEILKVSSEEVEEALKELSIFYQDRGLVLVKNNEHYTFGTSASLSDLIEGMQKEELNKSLSKASLETLSIVLYRNGASRAEIDYIRGVNSSFSLRALSVRGLVEKVPDPLDARKYIYKPTFELITFLGLQDISQLPEFGDLSEKLSQLKNVAETDTGNAS